MDSACSGRVLRWIYDRPEWFPALSDVAAWWLALAVSGLAFRVVDPETFGGGVNLVVTCVVASFSQGALGFLFGSYRHRWYVASFDEAMATAQAWAWTTAVVIFGSQVLARTDGSWIGVADAAPLGVVIALALIAGTRIAWRTAWEADRLPDPRTARRTVVYGSGEEGQTIIRLMLGDPTSEYYPVALLDDHPARRHRSILGVTIRGTRDDLIDVAEVTGAEVLLIAERRMTASALRELTAHAKSADLDVRLVPSTSDLVGAISLDDLQPPAVEDLLGRDPVDIDLASVSSIIRNKRVLITGAGGSIGSELSRQTARFEPSALFLLDRDESALHALQLSMDGRALLDSDRLVVADIRDRERILEVFEQHRPDVVFHAAALKHLTLLENHPGEAVKTNVLGTKNVLDAALEFGVTRFVNVSTDKAAEPTSVLGATKLAAERLTARASDQSGLPFVSVRFGNVLGSRGSVLPTFLEQIRQGQPITVTDPDVSRYFMTIPEAVRLVIQSAAIGRPGEVMILDMGESVRIYDLARQLVDSIKPGHPIEFTGLRAGEKLHEVLIASEELAAAREHPRILHTAGGRSDPASSFDRLADGDKASKLRSLTMKIVGEDAAADSTAIRTGINS